MIHTVNFLVDDGVSLNVLSNPYQQEAGISQGQFEIKLSKDETTTSIHVPSAALKSKWVNRTRRLNPLCMEKIEASCLKPARL